MALITGNIHSYMHVPSPSLHDGMSSTWMYMSSTWMHMSSTWMHMSSTWMHMSSTWMYV